MVKRPKQLNRKQKWVLTLLMLLMRLWTRTLRFRCSEHVMAYRDQAIAPSVVVLWHNCIVVAPEFFRRYFGQRKVASMISASQDGGWLAALFEKLGIQPIRGSQHARGGQALLEAMKAQAAGYDLAITPDGSRGPVYHVKPGAAAVAIHCQAPVLMLSFRFSRALRLRTWDRLYMPLPFSTVTVDVVSLGPELVAQMPDPQALTEAIQAQMDTMRAERP
jgi:lysophospholipid acyltransferase (LPLAT)-like uncharacterized protein